MKIAWTSIYGKVYEKDKCFDQEACSIGENLLLPGIALKKHFEELGHEYHTIDLYDMLEIDIVIFSDIPESILTVSSWKELLRYLMRRKWKTDWLYRVVNHIPKEKRILFIMEPPVIAPKSYMKKYHVLFGKILTWNDDFLKSEKYHKFCYPQPLPKCCYEVSFYDKRMLVMICGNKTSPYQNELYSERRKVIEFFEREELEFDFYGFGWEKAGYRNYKGITGQKLNTLSKYKYCICYENNCRINGYITEKIFDCFFAECIPVYWGAENIADYIPEECYIDRRKFHSLQEVYNFISRISEDEYKKYLDSMKEFLNSEAFSKMFSVDAYIKNTEEAIFGMD